MLNSDERRDVAARLSEVDAKYIENPEDLAQALAVCVTPETDYNFTDFPPALFARLANLIDPTCHFLPTKEGGYVCDRCYGWSNTMWAKPRCCSKCGARVVSADAE